MREGGPLERAATQGEAVAVRVRVEESSLEVDACAGSSTKMLTALGATAATTLLLSCAATATVRRGRGTRLCASNTVAPSVFCRQISRGGGRGRTAEDGEPERRAAPHRAGKLAVNDLATGNSLTSKVQRWDCTFTPLLVDQSLLASLHLI